MKDYIPKNKFDFEAVENLKLLKFESIRNDIPALLEWIQDMNWPVAYGVAEYLSPHINEMKDELLGILNSDDGMWKYWTVILISRLPSKPDPELISAIKRISDSPSKIEVEDEVNEVAKEVLIKLLA
jgi:hypothetical protein